MFGAGASFGVGDVKPGCPPLGKDLYQWLRATCPTTWGVVSGSLHSAFENDFEIGMSQAWASGTIEVQALLVDIGKAFAGFEPIPGGRNRYAELLKTMSTNRLIDRTVVATLNYECLLELSATQLGLSVDYELGRRNAGYLQLLKPHGSCNFLLPQNIKFINSTMSGVGQYYEGPVEAVWPPSKAVAYFASGQSMPAAMSLFAPGKPTPVAKGLVDNLRKAWREACQSAEVIAIIGVRPIWADAHVWDPIIASRSDVWYVGDDQSCGAIQARFDRTILLLGHTFEDAIGPMSRLLGILA